jgi:hypothetical protein
MAAKIAERIAEGFGLIGGIHGLLETFEKIAGVHEKLPEDIKQKLPGFLGLSLADEQIFNGVLGQLSMERQIVISRFLHDKCKDYERNRFINIVAGMEVIDVKKTEERKERVDDNGKKVTDTTIVTGDKKDKRQDFLEKFADLITIKFNNDLQKAYEFCIGGRMILPDPLHQKALNAFSESLKWAKSINWIDYSSQALERATAELRKTDICKKHEGFWKAAFPSKRWANAFWTFTVIVTIMFVGGFIFV